MIKLNKYDGAKIRCLYLNEWGSSLDGEQTKSIRKDLGLLDEYYDDVDDLKRELSDLCILFDLNEDSEIKKELDDDCIPYFKNRIVVGADSKLYWKLSDFIEFKFSEYLVPIAEISDSKLN